MERGRLWHEIHFHSVSILSALKRELEAMAVDFWKLASHQSPSANDPPLEGWWEEGTPSSFEVGGGGGGGGGFRSILRAASDSYVVLLLAGAAFTSVNCLMRTAPLQGFVGDAVPSQ